MILQYLRYILWEMMDSAIAKASRLGRRPGKKVAKRHLDVTGRIMLYEKDFNL